MKPSSEKKLKVLVTGGAGFIGSHTVVALQQHGFNVSIIDNLSNSQADVIDRVGEITGVKPEFHEFDLVDPGKTDSYFASNTDLAGIIHFAACKAVGESMKDPLLYYRNNLISLMNVLEGMRKHTLSNLVFSSSCTVYGQPDELPVKETSPIKEAVSAYGNTKQMAEDMLRFSVEAYGVKTIALRYFNAAGAHPDGSLGEDKTPASNLIPKVFEVALDQSEVITIYGDDYPTADGTGVRDYVHVLDLAAGHLAALQKLA